MKKIIHIGYPKAASSSLQENLFKNHPSFHYLNVIHPSVFYEMVYSLTEENFDSRKAETIFQQEVTQSFLKDKINIIADERFTANWIDYRMVADRLYHFLPEAKILVVIRNQADILRSRYDMHPYDYSDPRKKWLTFEEWLSSAVSRMKENFLNALHYDECISYYRDKFGVQNVHVLLFEKLVAFDSRTMEELGNVLKIDPGSIIDYMSVHKNKAGNHWLYHFKLKYFRGITFSRVIPAKWLKQLASSIGQDNKTKVSDYHFDLIAGLYRSGNRTIGEWLNTDLSEYGYPV